MEIPSTRVKVLKAPPKPKLTMTDYALAAGRLGVDVATIRAVTEVESGGAGFTKEGRCIIRFEPHKFSSKTRGQYDRSNPELSFPAWRPGYPTSVAHSWRLFERAAALNPFAAVWSTSWGAPQILGQNWVSCGCESISEFVRLMEAGEPEQLSLFVNLIDDWGLEDELQRKDWAGFARIYNGRLYKINKYDSRLATAYYKYANLNKFS